MDKLPKKYRVIYSPTGRAREYSELALNLANGCIHGCKYCYVPRIIKKQKADFHKEAEHRVDVLKNLELDLIEMSKIGDKRKVMFSFTTDPYQPIDGFNEMTREALELFKKYDQPFHLLTKGANFAKKDFDLYKEGDEFACSLTFINPKNSQKIEPNTAKPEDRLNALKLAKSMGINTWVSFEPVCIAEETIELYELSKSFVDFYKIGKITGYDEFDVDWDTFAEEITERMEMDGQAFYIKDDLRPHLPKKVSEYKYHREIV